MADVSNRRGCWLRQWPHRWQQPPTLLAAACLVLATCAAAAPPADAQADTLCALGPVLNKPAPLTLKGCVQAVCTAAGEQLLCTCKTASAWQYQRRTVDRVLQRWPTEVSPMTGADAFELRQADIAADGRPRWLVARALGVSNGLGVSTHELCVVDPDNPPALLPATPVCRRVQEWQALTLMVQEPGQPGCSLMDSAWQPGREPGRGPGTYAAGRLWRWQGQQWQAVPIPERQAVARRLLPTFMNQREELPRLQSTAGTLWYQHATAQHAACPGPLCPQPASAR